MLGLPEMPSCSDMRSEMRELPTLLLWACHVPVGLWPWGLLDLPGPCSLYRQSHHLSACFNTVGGPDLEYIHSP